LGLKKYKSVKQTGNKNMAHLQFINRKINRKRRQIAEIAPCKETTVEVVGATAADVTRVL